MSNGACHANQTENVVGMEQEPYRYHAALSIIECSTVFFSFIVFKTFICFRKVLIDDR